MSNKINNLQSENDELFSGKLSLREGLDQLKARLLDLSARNSLINYRHPKARCIRFINQPNLNAVFDRLYTEAKPIGIRYIEEPKPTEYEGKKPDVKTYAENLGLDISYDIDDQIDLNSLKQSKLLALYYPEELERHLRKLSTEAKTVIEETGSNVLYVILGFLEFFESEDSDRPLIAPLIAIPIKLVKDSTVNKDSGTYLYSIEHNGEDLAENLTLKEKLIRDLGINLPDLEDDSPIQYFEKIQKLISKKKRWKIRKNLTVGMLSFGKLAIWRDLGNIEESNIIQTLFLGSDASYDGESNSTTYKIDEKDEWDLQLIYDADSSQQSAIIDVLNGKNIVINGPPGTGKSQTITNIIASALVAGKKVLFVSEKLAALEVVRRRLDSAGLGQFCLELHSHKTNKKEFIEEIKKRMEATFQPPRQLKTKIDEIKHQKNELKRYTELIGSIVCNELSLTCHQIFWAIDIRRHELGETIDPLKGMAYSNAKKWTYEYLISFKSDLSQLVSLYKEIGKYDELHPWWGFSPKTLFPTDDQIISSIIKKSLPLSEKASNASIECLDYFNLKEEIDLVSAIRIYEKLSIVEDVEVNVDILAKLQKFDQNGLQSQKLLNQIDKELQAAQDFKNITKEIYTNEIRPSPQYVNYFKSSFEKIIFKKNSQKSLSELLDFKNKLLKVTNEIDLIGAKLTNEIHTLDLRLFQKLLNSKPKLNVYKLENTNTNKLKDTNEKLLKQIEFFNTALLKVKKLSDNFQLKNNFTEESLRKLITGQEFPFLKIDLHSEINIQNLELISTHQLSHIKISELHSLHENFSFRFDEIKYSKNLINDILNTANLSFSGQVEDLKGLISIANAVKNAPYDLLHFRSEALLQPRTLNNLLKLEDYLEDDKNKKAELAKIFYMDVLPSIEEIKKSIVILRSKNGFLSFLDIQWRVAVKLHKNISKSEVKLSSKQRTEELSQLLTWLELRESFKSLEVIYEDCFGTAFNGLETNVESIRKLIDWLKDSNQMLNSSGKFASSINLVELKPGIIESLTANHISIIGSVNTILNYIEDYSKSFNNKFSNDNSSNLEECLNKIESDIGSVKELIDSFKFFTESCISPIESLNALKIFNEVKILKDDFETLINGPVHLRDTIDPIFCNALEGFPNSWPERINHLKSYSDFVYESINLANNIYHGDAYFNDLFRISELYIYSLHLLEDLNIKDQITDIASWTSYINKIKEFTKDVDDFISKAGEFIKVDNSTRQLEEAIQADEEHHRIINTHSLSDKVQNLMGNHYIGIDTHIESFFTNLNWLKKISSLSIPDEIKQKIYSEGSEGLNKSKKLFFDISDNLKEVKDLLDNLSSYGDFDWNRWNDKTLKKIIIPSHVFFKLDLALHSIDRLIPWANYLTNRTSVNKRGLKDLVLFLEDEEIPPDLLVKSFEYVMYQSIGRSIYEEYPELRKFSATSHNSIRTEFQKLDKEIIKLNGKDFANSISFHADIPSGVQSYKASELTEEALLKHEVSKSKKFIPIRQLMKRAGKALQEYKPVFMMGPLSVAQYLELGALEFDLVVMDEASQLRPEDAIGAIARGKQIVIVGDAKQLPPSNFFNRLLDSSDDEDEETPATFQGTESILDICQQIYAPVRSLKWHYRSQHESLIAFSNHHFYKNLIVFPSPYERVASLGVKYKYIANGIYKDRQNFPEAIRVVDAIINHMIKRPDESLGVVTLNNTQRELIEELLAKKMKSFSEMQNYISYWDENGSDFFVKNLENVQGDERDVIYISTTFGKPPGVDKIRQNFGPISRPDGWRRLNVLFTRAKKRIELYTSMSPGDIPVDEKTPEGTKIFQEYLDYAKRGTLATSDYSLRDFDSDFEISVAEQIKEWNYEVRPQHGVAGYFIDLVVKHPTRSGEFLAAIECDGATYHSGVSVRDRDRIRQEILESMGWKNKIYRIWSTDWFYSPREASKKLRKFLEDRVQQSNNEVELEIDAIGDENLIITDVSLGETNEFDFEVAVEEDLFIEVGDRVTYSPVENLDEKNIVLIVDEGESNLRYGVLKEDTPLAQALMGLTVGETAKLNLKSNGKDYIKEFNIIKIEKP